MLSITLCLLPRPVYSATEIPALLVSAARAQQSTLTTPASITVISRQQIEDSGARHIVELLRAQGGIQINDFYGDGSRASVDMRGFGDSANANTLVLVDGRRLNNPDIAAPDLNSIALDDVESIEIVQGSAGVLFGDQAVGGVINIISRQPSASRHALKLSAGSFSSVDFHVMSSQALASGFDYRVSLDVRQSDNYREHNESEYLNGSARLGYDYGSGALFAELQYIDDELNTPGALFADEVAEDRVQVNASFAGDFSNSQTTVARLGMVHNLSTDWSLEAEATSRDSDGLFRISFAGAPAASENFTQDRSIHEFTPRFIGQIAAWNDSLLTLGADIVDSDYHLSTSFGDQFNDQSQRSLYAQLIVPLTERVDVTVGARHASVDNDLRDAGFFAVYPAGVNIDDDITVGTLGLAIKAGQSWRVLFRADQNYRFAKVDELLQPAFSPAFSPLLLETQQGLSLEAGLEWSRAANTAKIIAYRLLLENEIVFDPVNFANINLDDTVRKGLISSARWLAAPRLAFSASYTFTDAEVSSGALDGKDIPLVAQHSALLSADYSLSASWLLFAEVVSKSERVLAGDFDNTLSRLPGYGLLNIRAEYAHRDFSFSGRINNVLDKSYADIGQLGFDPAAAFAPAAAFYPSPRINFLLTAAWQFR